MKKYLLLILALGFSGCSYLLADDVYPKVGDTFAFSVSLKDENPINPNPDRIISEMMMIVQIVGSKAKCKSVRMCSDSSVNECQEWIEIKDLVKFTKIPCVH